MKVTLEVPDDKYEVFLKHLEGINYVTIDENDYTVPEWNKKIVRERKRNTIEEDYVSWERIEKQINLDG